jgi:DNA-binding response OmpR family regulator
VLVVDDEPDLLALVRSTLELAGHEVVTASDGVEAVRVAVASSPDAVVLDIMMPRQDGLTTLRQLRQGPRTQSIPVLLLSAKAGAIDVEVGMKAGAAGYMTKPFAPSDLVAEVQRITGQD